MRFLRFAVRKPDQLAAVAVLIIGLAMTAAPPAQASGEIPSGTYDVVTSSVLDRWVMTPKCTELVVGCEVDVHSDLIDGQAYYQGRNMWAMALKGMVPVCPDRTKTAGAMLFQWDSQTLEGQLTTVQRGLCQMTRPGQDQIPFTLVKVSG